MYIWNITLYEPSPVNGRDVRPMRSGMLTQALCDTGHVVELWMPGFEHVHHVHYQKESIFEKISDNLGIQYIKGSGYDTDTSLKRFVHNRQIAYEFNQLTKKRKEYPHLLVTQVPSLELAEAVVKFSKKNKIPVVVDVRDLWPDVYKRLFPYWCRFLYYIIFLGEIFRVRRIFNSASAITAVSKSYLEWGVCHSGRNIRTDDKVFSIGYSNKIENISYKKTCNVKFKFIKKYEDMVITFAGTFCSSYDLFSVIEAAKILISKNISNIKFVIAGSGEKEQILRKKSKHLPNIFFVGWLGAEDLQQLLLLTDVGLAPYSESALMSLPNKIFEYMAASLPILTSLDGELRQLIEKNAVGTYYIAGDAEMLVKSLLHFRNRPEIRIKMGQRARRLFESEYTQELIYPKFAKHLTMIGNRIGGSNVKH